MIIRKIKTKNKSTKQNMSFARFVFFGVMLFVGSLYLYTRYFYGSGSVLDELTTSTPLENNIAGVWSEGSELDDSGYLFPYLYNRNGKDYYFYIMLTQDGVKYILSVDQKDFKDESFPAEIKGKINTFIGPIPYIFTTNIKRLAKSSLGTGYKVPTFNKEERTEKLKTISIKMPNVVTPIRDIPDGGMEFTSHKGYTMYFPKKIYYEVILTKETFGVEGLFCDNAVLVVGRDKSKYINSDRFYVRNNARLKVFVCIFEPPIGYNSKLPPKVKDTKYMTTESNDLHFYIQTIHPSWDYIADQIAVRSKK